MVNSLMLVAYLPVSKKEAEALMTNGKPSLGHLVLVGCPGHMRSVPERVAYIIRNVIHNYCT